MYNKSEIMKAAWKMYCGLSRNLRGEIMGSFADCLKLAWLNAKHRAVRRANDIDTDFLYQMQDHHSNAEVAAHYYESVA